MITEAGSDPKVVGLVYVAAFVPDKGESVSSMIAGLPPGAAQPPILPPQDGYLFLDRAKFWKSFAADVRPEKAAFMADSQAPWGMEALNGAITEPVWKMKPSWYVISTEDKMIPPDAQRSMSKRAGSAAVEGQRQPCRVCVATTGSCCGHRDGCAGIGEVKMRVEDSSVGQILCLAKTLNSFQIK